MNANLAAGKAPYDAVVEAAVSRLRPVFGLAVTTMAGLTIGTGFTMIAVPVLYATFYGIPAREAAGRNRRDPGEQRRSRPAEAWPPAYYFAGFDRHRGRGTKAS